jgi:hypothetical protein
MYLEFKAHLIFSFKTVGKAFRVKLVERMPRGAAGRSVRLLD